LTKIQDLLVSVLKSVIIAPEWKASEAPIVCAHFVMKGGQLEMNTRILGCPGSSTQIMVDRRDGALSSVATSNVAHEEQAPCSKHCVSTSSKLPTITRPHPVVGHQQQQVARYADPFANLEQDFGDFGEFQSAQTTCSNEK
jgi:hypothetical protein